jgi:hypothetical protein
LFEETAKVASSKIEMTPDEVIDFLKDVEKGFNQRDDTFPYVEKYLEFVV